MKYPRLVHVTSVEVLRDFFLRLSFDDGTTREVDVDELLRGPVFEPLRKDPKLFRQVRVEGGTTVWPNGADIDPAVLHGSARPAWQEERSSAAVPSSSTEKPDIDKILNETAGSMPDLKVPSRDEWERGQ